MAIKRIRRNARKTKAIPFGSPIVRFDNLGLHPGLYKTGVASKRNTLLGPGCYDAEEFECAYKKYNIGGSTWTRKKEAEEFSQNLGFRNAHVLKEREFQNSLGGPGAYDINESVYKKCPASAMSNVTFGRLKRFSNILKKDYPPPGTYSKDQTKSVSIKKQFTHVPPFEWDGFLDRLRINEPAYIKPPTHYTPKYPNCINATLAKVVSKRGPYDCFTGPRDGSTIKNHFAPPSFKGPINFFNSFPSEFDNLLHNKRYEKRGRFLKDIRFGRVTQRHLLDDQGLCYHDPNAPSPCTYEVERERTFVENLHHFNSSVRYARPLLKWAIHPGVGRYSPKPPQCPNKKTRESWVFQSKCQRTEYKAVEYNAF